MPGTATIERPAPSAGPVAGPPAGGRWRRGPRPSMATLFGACFALFAWAIQLRPLQDNSFLWHLRTGHWILGHGIPRADLYSFTAPDAPWVVQSWLAEVLYAGIDAGFGPFGLRVFRATLSAMIAFLVFRLATRLTGERPRAAILTLAALTVSFTLWSERPLLLGVLGMVVLLWIVEVPASFLGRHPALALPPLLWLWANVHGTFALGFAFLAAHLAGRWLDGARPWTGRERSLLVGSAAGLALCFVNPLGTSLLTFPVHLLARGDVLDQVLEWRSPDFHTFIGVLFAIWVAIFVFALAGSGRRSSRRDLVVGVSFLLLGLWALRNLALVPIVGLAVAARALAVDEERPDGGSPLNWAVLGLLAVLGVTALSQAGGVKNYNLDTYPVGAMEVVEERGLLGGRLLTTDAWSAYVIHRYWPRQQVFMDDRYDMYPTALAEEYFKLARAAPEWQDILDRHSIGVVVWPKEKPLAQVLDLAPGWERIHTDELAQVWVRRSTSE
jgi:hypothetical protein